MAGIELPWYVILSQWTGFYKLGRNGFSWFQHCSYVMELKNFLKIFVSDHFL